MKKLNPIFEVTMASRKTGEYFNNRMTRREVGKRLYSPADVLLVTNLMDNLKDCEASFTINEDTYKVRLVA